VKRTLNEKFAAQKSPVQDRAFDFLVAGARYENYMQIKIDPFPLVA
jgi:hypothetical protein